MSPERVTVSGVEWELQEPVTDGEQLWTGTGEHSLISVDNAVGGQWGWTIWGHLPGTYLDPPEDWEADEGSASTRDEAMAAAVAAYDRYVDGAREADEALEEQLRRLEP